MSDDDHITRARDWMNELGALVHTLVPEPFRFALVLYHPGHPDAAALLTPDPPPEVAEILANLAATVRAGSVQVMAKPHGADEGWSKITAPEEPDA